MAVKPVYSSLFFSVVAHGTIFLLPTEWTISPGVRQVEGRDRIHLVSLITSPGKPLSADPSLRPDARIASTVVSKKSEAGGEKVNRPPPHRESAENAEPQAAPFERVASATERQEMAETPVEQTEAQEAEVVGTGSESVAETKEDRSDSSHAGGQDGPILGRQVMDGPVEGGAGRSFSLRSDEQGPSGAIAGMRDIYLARLRERIEAVRRYPDRARRMGQEGTVVVRFVVKRDGQIDGIALMERASSTLINQAAVETIRSIDRLPPLPAEFGGQMEVALPLVYRLEQTVMR